MDDVLGSVIVTERLKENLSQRITDRILSLVFRSKVMIEMSKTFEKFQLFFNFVLFFTLKLLFSIHDQKYTLAR